MFTSSIVVAACLAGAALTAPAAAAAPLAPAASEPDYAKLVADKGTAIVTIKFVLRVDYAGRQEEHEQERTGVMIDGKGLVLCTNSSVGGMPPAVAKRYGNPTLTPTKIRILVGDDTEGVEAKLIARDSDLDLAWIRVDKTPDKPFIAISFADAPQARIGEHLIVLDRLPKTFDRVSCVSDLRISAVIKKPRPMLHAGRSLSHISTPIFNDDLKAVGFAAAFIAADEDDEGEESMAPQAVVVPASEIVSATDRALKTAEANAAAEPKEDETPAKTEDADKK